jgi:hypothetical protein
MSSFDWLRCIQSRLGRSGLLGFVTLGYVKLRYGALSLCTVWYGMVGYFTVRQVGYVTLRYGWLRHVSAWFGLAGQVWRVKFRLVAFSRVLIGLAF